LKETHSIVNGIICVMQKSLGEECPIEKSTTSARQGVTGHNVRHVLAISLGVAIVVLACLWLAFFVM
jgi:hypothetical protein